MMIVKKQCERIMLFMAVHSGLRMLIGATSTVFLIDIKGFTVNEVALLRAMQFIIILFSDIPLSYFADKRSRRFSILSGMLCSAIWLFLVALSYTKALVYLGEVFNALSLSFFSGAGIALLVDYYNSDPKNAENIDGVRNIISKQRLYANLSKMVAIGVSAFFSMGQLNLLWSLTGIASLFLWGLSLYWLPIDIANYTHGEFYNFRKNVLTVSALIFNKHVFIVFIIFSILISYFNNIVNYNQVVTYTAFPEWNFPAVHSIVFFAIIGVQAAASHSGSKIPNFLLAIAFIVIFFALFFTSNPWFIMILWISTYYIYVRLSINVSAMLHNNIGSRFRSTVDSIVNSFGLLQGFALSMFFI